MEGPSQLQSEPPLANDLPVAVPGPSQQKHRNRLGAEGLAILEAYLSSISDPLQLPPLSDRKELTRRIKELPDCGYWNDKYTTEWFKRRKKKFQKCDPAYSLLVSKLVSPSKNSLQHLDTLLKSQPNPSSDVIRTWATLFAQDGGSVAVELWISYITQVVQASSRSSDCPLPPSANLPTPAGTVTPEPLMPQASSSSSSSSNQSLPPTMKRDPADSPLLGSLTIRIPPSTSTAEIESPVPPSLRDGQTKPVTSLRAIIGDAVQASQHPVDRIRPLPNDADEFLAMFAPYEAKLTKLLHIFQESQH